MKKVAITIVKFIVFFLGWAILAILSAILPLSTSENPAIWRLWAEVTPLLSIVAVTFLFWLMEKKTVKLQFLNKPIKGILTGAVAGAVWLGTTVIILLLLNIIGFQGRNEIPLFGVWVLAAFLNVIMQELLVRGYLYQMLNQRYNGIVAAIVTTLLFTFLHGGAFEAGIIPVMNVFTMSLLMTVVLEYSGSIIAPTIMHFLWNGIGALVLGGVSLADDYPHWLNMTFSGTEILSGGTYKMEGSIVVLILNIILISIFVYFCDPRPGKELG